MRLSLILRDLLEVIDDIALVVSAAVMCLSHAARVVGQVDVAVVAWTLLVRDLGGSCLVGAPTEE